MRELTTEECGHLRYILAKLIEENKEGIDIPAIDRALAKIAKALNLEIPDTDYASTYKEDDSDEDTVPR